MKVKRVSQKCDGKSNISLRECKKVVSEILGEIEFLTDIKSADKMTHF